MTKSKDTASNESTPKRPDTTGTTDTLASAGSSTSSTKDDASGAELPTPLFEAPEAQDAAESADSEGKRPPRLRPARPKKGTRDEGASRDTKERNTRAEGIRTELGGGVELVRLNVWLQEHGVASRRKADGIIEQRRVQVNGEVVAQLGTRIPADAVVKVDGKVVRAKSVATRKVVFMLHKPDMCLTSRSDTQGRRTIFDLPALHKIPSNVQAVGRLDYRSEGLLLLTNDGDLAYALTHPRYAVEKHYAVLTPDVVNAEDIDRLRRGVELDDGFAKPLTVRVGNKERLGVSRGQWIEIVVAEGRNRLIRRMMEAVGLKVGRLVRLAIGDLTLPERLSSGHVQPVSDAELSYLEKLKAEMLEEREGGRKAAAAPLSERDKLKRKLKRKLTLNDAEYEEEKQRRAAALGSKRKVRKETYEEIKASYVRRDDEGWGGRSDRARHDDRADRGGRPVRARVGGERGDRSERDSRGAGTAAAAAAPGTRVGSRPQTRSGGPIARDRDGARKGFTPARSETGRPLRRPEPRSVSDATASTNNGTRIIAARRPAPRPNGEVEERRTGNTRIATEQRGTRSPQAPRGGDRAARGGTPRSKPAGAAGAAGAAQTGAGSTARRTVRKRTESDDTKR